MPEEEEFALTDLSERLRGADCEQVARQVAQRLADLRNLVDGWLGVGSPPDEYQRLRRQSDALAAARRVMLKMTDYFPVLEQDNASKSHERQRG